MRVIQSSKTIVLKSSSGEELEIYIPQDVNKLRLSPGASSGKDLMEIVSRYLDTDPMLRDVLFNSAKRLFDRTVNYPRATDNADTIAEYTHELMYQVIAVMNFEHALDWVVKNTHVSKDIEEEFDETKRVKGHTKAQTYTVKQYHDVVTLGLVLKILSPLWFAYQRYIENSLGYMALQRLVFNILPKPVRHLRAWGKLQEFVEQSTAPKEVRANQTLAKGITEIGKSDYVLAMLIQRIILTTIGHQGDKNVVSQLYSQVEQIFRLEKRKLVKPKVMVSQDQGDGEYPLMESYRDQESLAIHDKVILRYVSGIDQLILHFAKAIKVTRTRLRAQRLRSRTTRFNNLHETIAACVLRYAVPNDAYDLMSVDDFKGCCAVTSELLRDNHPELSLLMISGFEVEENTLTSMTQPVKTNMNINVLGGNIRKDIRQMFPFYNVTGAVTTANMGQKLTPKKNVVTSLIRDLAEQADRVWVPNLVDGDGDYYKSYLSSTTGNLLPLNKIQLLLAELFIDLDNIGTFETPLDKALAGELEIN